MCYNALTMLCERMQPEAPLHSRPKLFLADNISQLHHFGDDDDVTEGESAIADKLNDTKYGVFHSVIDDPELLKSFDCYLNPPTVTTLSKSPLNYECIHDQQQADADFLAQQQQYPQQYINKSFCDVSDMTCYVRPGHNPNSQWKTMLAANILQSTIQWFHQILVNARSKRLCMSLSFTRTAWVRG